MSNKSRSTFDVIKNNIKIGSFVVKSNREYKPLDRIKDFGDSRMVKGIIKDKIKEDFDGLMQCDSMMIGNNLKIVRVES